MLVYDGYLKEQRICKYTYMDISLIVFIDVFVGKYSDLYLRKRFKFILEE
jgi:hypothetical protein